MKNVITKTAIKPGPTVTIMGGVHGNEICGVQAVQRAIRELEIDYGKVYFILGNLEAIAMNQRATAPDLNLNRSFKPAHLLNKYELASYERRRAEQIMPYLVTSSALLDIHSSPSEESTPFVICEPQSYPISQYLPFSICSRGWDIIQAGGTDYFMNLNGNWGRGGQGICVECGYHKDPYAPEFAWQSILTFLTLTGNLKKILSEPIRQKQRLINANYIYKCRVDFVPARRFADFEPVAQGTLLGYDGGQPVLADHDAAIIFPVKCSGPDQEAFVLGLEE